MLTGGLAGLARLSKAETRSISAENFTGGKGQGGAAVEGIGAHAARELGQGWKISPCIRIEPHQTVTIADIPGAGIIQHLWITVAPVFWRSLVLRFYWDEEADPSIEVPLGDFFCNGWCSHCHVNSLPIVVNPSGGFNSYWEMPFRNHARVTVQNLTGESIPAFFYQITYALTEVSEDTAYLHAQWRRSNPVRRGEVHTLLDGVNGDGHYVGTYIAWGSNNNGWWGEGEIKFYMDGDVDFPTICGTGTEDYFGGAWNFEYPKGTYSTYSTPFLGFPQVIKPDGLYVSQQRFGMYRWHIPDPIRFHRDLRVTIQALGGGSEGRHLQLQDDLASTAFWYQTEPHTPFQRVLERNHLEVI